MVVSATSIQIPLKIEFPILFSNNPIRNCQLLGMGDILLPGIVIKYCRRFDLIRQKIKPGFNGMSFYAFNMILYIVSVALAMIMMFVFNHAQPVLFYIGPIFIIGLMGKAYKDKVLSDFWNGFKKRKPKNLNDNNNNNDKKNEDGKNDEENNEKKNEDGNNDEKNNEEEDEEDKKDKLIENDDKSINN